MKQALHILLLLAWGLAGCRGNIPDRPAEPSLARSLGLAEPSLVESVHAIASPPRGWAAEPLKQSDRHAHQVWMSPTGRTAYGVIHFALPGIADIFGIPYDWVLRGYLDEMRKDQGEATLLSKSTDPELPGLRFVAEGGLYRTYTNLIVAGADGWAVYAGVLRAQPMDQAEFELAEHAREQTRIRQPQ